MIKPQRFQQNTSSFAHYWSEGAGVELLQTLGFTPPLSRAETLIPLLSAWDSLGDQLVLDMYTPVGFKQGHAWLWTYLNKRTVPPAQKQLLDDFMAAVDLSPDWVDPKRLRIGQELCQRAGLSSLIVLRDYCLMGGYESAAINKPLIYTGALKKGAVKRLTETVEFWVKIMKADALSPDGEGLKHILATRMIHSFSRVNILSRSDWDTNLWGVPLNLWDMLATNLGFSMVFLVGLRRMGLQPTAAEIDGLFHLWKYIGHLLGIPIAIIPEDELAAIEALYYWTMTQQDGDQDSKDLAEALCEEPVAANYPKSALMRKMMREVHIFYNYFLLGDHSCKLLGLPSTKIGRLAVINIWRAKKMERQLHLGDNREKMILEGAAEQENVRRIYQIYNA